MQEKLKDYTVFPVRIENSTYKELKKLSYLNEVPVSVLVRQGIKLRIDFFKKQLTNEDIAI